MKRTLVVGLGSLVAAGAIGGIIALAAVGPNVTAPPKVAVVQRSDATTPTTTVPAPTTTTAPQTVPPASASGPQTPAVAPVASPPTAAPQTDVQGQVSTPTTQAPSTTPTSTVPITYCEGSLAADEAVPLLPAGWVSNGNGGCIDSFGTFWNAGGSQYNTEANGAAGRATYRVG